MKYVCTLLLPLPCPNPSAFPSPPKKAVCTNSPSKHFHPKPQSITNLLSEDWFILDISVNKLMECVVLGV